MTPADRRLLEQIDRWLGSIDQHMKYVGLSEAEYRKAQAWPAHDRPTRWILEIARQKILDLKAQIDSRSAMGDSKFAEALELMAFIATLVGVQNIQRFIPQADTPNAAAQAAATVAPTVEVKAPPAAATGTQSTLRTVIQPSQRETPAPPAGVPPRPVGDEPTREMPRMPTRSEEPEEFNAPVLIPQRRESKKPAAKAPVMKEPESKTSAAQDAQTLVVADAIRLLKWGKEWHELAELIGRIADRPPVPEIRKILRSQRTKIEAKASQRG